MRGLAARAGLSAADVSRILSGERKRPSPRTLRGLARALSLPPAYLLFLGGILEEEEWRSLDRSCGTGAGETRSPVYGPSGLTEEEWEMVLMLRSIPSRRTFESLRQILRALCDREERQP